MNNAKTFVLLAALTALFLLIGNVVGGHSGLLIAFVLALVMNVGAYWFSDTIVLKMFKATPLEENHPVYGIISGLAKQAQIPMPKVYAIDNPTPNAFATGRDPQHAAVAVTSGILSRLTHEELTGVLAHEMCHIIHRDTLISTVAATLAGAISSLANMSMWSSALHQEGEQKPNPIIGFLMMILAPLAASLVQMAVSRSREFAADAGGAQLCGHPLWLASALAKLELANKEGQFQQAEEHPSTAHLFIVNPLSSEKLAQLFSTHPLTQERIKRLQEMSTQQ